MISIIKNRLIDSSYLLPCAIIKRPRVKAGQLFRESFKVVIIKELFKSQIDLMLLIRHFSFPPLQAEPPLCSEALPQSMKL